MVKVRPLLRQSSTISSGESWRLHCILLPDPSLRQCVCVQLFNLKLTNNLFIDYATSKLLISTIAYPYTHLPLSGCVRRCAKRIIDSQNHRIGWVSDGHPAQPPTRLESPTCPGRSGFLEAGRAYALSLKTAASGECIQLGGAEEAWRELVLVLVLVLVLEQEPALFSSNIGWR